ncbi:MULTISPECIES: 4'-phosphopantetheinyl transferase family protein [unclassified Streptomyces]|uniref:4'-phosphopantetheinyl transferase family protein n=1 Tax=unclassified Streptomyces TaxID=2593676 RepID=UPI00037E8B27|nr:MULTISPECIES: 4'-phosphopantetheinyl transferase superfamily protein [unclassified Streptomyces]MYQ78586.1 4'-phosphopantetheinyl transferase superfamily protein [Streptomyces sp. SID4923]
MINSVLPPEVAAMSVFGDLSSMDGHGLFPAEVATIAHSVPRRRAEFTTVRLCARRALGRLGVPPVPLVPGKRGAVEWPAGVTGSMTHCTGFRAAAVARSEVAASLGIDAERNEPLPEGILEVVSLPRERAAIAALTRQRPDVHWDRLLFSAKESVFKTWYPLTRRELDFTEAELQFDLGTRTFSARLLVPGPVVAGRRHGTFSGRWTAGRGFVLTAIVLPGRADPPDGITTRIK